MENAPEWKHSEYGSSQNLDLGIMSLCVIYRSGTRNNPIPADERYEFRINGLTSTKKFASAEEAKKIAISSARNRLNAALEILNKIQN